MVLNSTSYSSAKSDINIERDIVIKLRKKEYLLVTLFVCPATEDRIKKLMLSCNGILQSVKQIQTAYYNISYLVPVDSIDKLIGKMPIV